MDLIEGITEYFSGEYTRWRGQRSFTKLGPTLNIVKAYSVARVQGGGAAGPHHDGAAGLYPGQLGAEGRVQADPAGRLHQV